MVWSKIQINCVLFFCLATFCLVCSCEKVPKKDPNAEKVVCTSFYLLADLARKIVGDEMNVQCVMPVGSDVHSWEPTPKKVLEMTRADAFLMNGAGLEEWTEDVLPLLEKRGIPVFEAADSVELGGTHECDCDHDREEEGHEEHHHEAGPDPHIWLSVRNTKTILRDLTAFFCELDPKNAELYRANCEKCVAECDALDAEFQETTKELKSRKLVVAHSAFWYLCRDYGLEQVALEGYSAYSDPSPAQMVKIIAFIRENQIPVIYAASSESSKSAEAIARETGVKVGILHPLGTLTQAQIDAGADYFSVMRENLAGMKLLSR